ncbi:DUF402 domain-containing protein [Paenibacillus silvisoli]|uniref:DUF402 domain-containing protein n=1 Tax=Paenibacillus silvisoli TaxID=3110539 RepID=UPI0028054261|nr:DUF402 domain-containing protein [Paenibacillus silvisoli]
MMYELKRKHGDRADWKRVLEREYAQAYLDDEHFRGHITLLNLFKVTEPLYVSYGDKRICIVNDGYAWLQQFPSDRHHAVTTMFDDKGQVVQWYIDICCKNGVGPDEVPWMDDLFLDIVVLPTGEVIRKDADELEEALASGAIDSALYQLAKEEADRLISLIHESRFALLHQSDNHRVYLLEKLQAGG